MSKGEDSTSSQTSSVVWECVTDGSTELTSLSASVLLNQAFAVKPGHSSSNLDDETYFHQKMRSRSELMIRNRYLQKLQNTGLLPQRPRKKSHHVIIFDWDDTLFCTSFMQTLLQGEWTRAAEWEKEKVQEIDKIAAEILERALELGEVCIVTNSVEGWVDYCSQTFMAQTYEIIVNRKVPIVSARERSEAQFPNDPQRWKTEAFANLISDLSNETVLNMISVGDSNYELQAAEHSTRRFDRRFIKTIKLREKPRIQQLSKQLKLISTRLGEVFSSHKNLTIRLQPKQ